MNMGLLDWFRKTQPSDPVPQTLAEQLAIQRRRYAAARESVESDNHDLEDLIEKIEKTKRAGARALSDA